mmetsp:Transcript_26536/g.89293  ORF Transcript_26536/g.89293 Transcript_26536/m.89293 type:complete len:371 (+) Transcript_26536:1222-2334(+)
MGRPSAAYEAATSKVEPRRNVMRLDFGNASFRSKISKSLAAPTSSSPFSSSVSIAAAGSQLSLTPYDTASTTSKGLTLKRGEAMAAIMAHPLETHSSAFSVVFRPWFTTESSKPSSLARRNLTAATRDPPPVISTEWRADLSMSSASRSASITGWSSRASKGATRSENFSNVRSMEKSRSLSKHSQKMRASATPFGDKVFFAFSAASKSFMNALGSLIGSQPCFFLNSSLMCCAITMSKSRPPSARSHVVALTTRAPFWYSTMETWYAEKPQSMNMTFWVPSSKAFFADRQIPYSNAVAVKSFIRRRQLMLAILQASSMASRSASPKYAGTDTTISLKPMPPLLSAAMEESLKSIIAASCGMDSTTFSSA